MKLARLDVRRFEVSLRRSLVTSAGTLRERRGFLVRVADAEGNVGLGEASPAYWLGDESLEHVESVVQDLQGVVGADDPLAGLDEWRLRSPSVACALETACLDLEGRRREVSVAELLGGVGGREVPVSALLFGGVPDAVARTAASLAELGHPAVKLKVGAGDVADDVQRLESIRAVCGAGLAVRLDANRAWSVGKARKALTALKPFGPAFVEEPLTGGTPVEWRSLRTEIGVPLAGDESIPNLPTLRAFAEARALDVVVLKPARLGGPTAVLDVAREAARFGITVVVTDSIETSVGRALAAHVAAALPGEVQPIGLGGASVLESDPHGLVPVQLPRLRVSGPGLGL
jgi:o-succinylbenzoate synthase